MDDLESSLARVRGAWMAGRPAFEYCPPEWRGAVTGADAECALAALTGHAAAVLFRPAPASPPESRSFLPGLALPTLPELLRPRARRLMAAQKGRAAIERHLIDLIAARGYAMHPADWTPSARDDWTPDVYAPWLDWIRGEDKPFPPPAFTLDTYDQWSFAMRRAALAALRVRDPGAARAIIAAKAAFEPAERRVMLIEILETGLSEQDAELLEAQANDRSDRLQALTRLYLARLGRRADADPLAAELANMLEVRKGEAPRDRTQLAINALKSAAQNARRRDLFKLVSLPALAHALRMTEDEIIETAPAGAPDGVEAFVQMVAATGSDRARRMLLDKMLDDEGFPLAHARPLGPRLTVEERRALQTRIIERDAEAFETTLTLMGRVLGEAPLSALLASPSYAALTGAIEAARGEDEAQRRAADAVLETTLNRIALLAAAPAATDLLARLTDLGLSSAGSETRPVAPQRRSDAGDRVLNEILRFPVEITYAAELEALKAGNAEPKPKGWVLSPRAAMTYLMGGNADNGMPITAKYVGDKRLIETAIATLATDRALLLLGVPGTAKSWVSEHLAAAVSGDSTIVIQCTAGTDENQIRYGWNYAQLIAHGPSRQALVPTPLFRAMEAGKLCRLEELTRMGSDVQDTLITVLSEKMMPIAELNDSVYATRGFNIIATANSRDKGVNELSSALKRRFNVVVLPLPNDLEQEVAIVAKRVGEMSQSLDLPAPKNVAEEVARVVAIFRELRGGATADGKMTLKSPSGTLSAAEAIGVMIGGLSHAAFFNDGELSAEGVAPNMIGAIVKDPVQDKAVLEEYLEVVLKKRPDYADYYRMLSDLI